MEALLNRILTLNLIATTVVFYVAARIYLLPQLGRLRPRVVLIPILLLHSLRHLGLMFLTRGATYPGLPPQFAYPAALGDLLTAVLAFVAIFFVSRDSTFARAFGLGPQCLWLNRFAHGDHPGDHLQRASVYGTSLLDSCVLGSCSAGHSLHHVSYPDQILERSSMSLLEGEERPLLRLVITLGGSNLKTRAAFICSTAGRGLAHLASVRDLVSF